MTGTLLFDLVLLVAVVAFGYRAIHAPELFTGVIVYIVYGLLLSIVWVRLGAADVAIAEAAIGAGITGALLLDTATRLSPRPLPRRIRFTAGLGAAVLTGVVTIAVAFAMMSVGNRTGTLAPMISANLPRSGAEHPVTAVLLDFRGYDTFLEVTVLLAAGVAILALSKEGRLGGRGGGTPEPLLSATASIVIPFAFLVAGYLIWRGTHAPGGAFQAGAVMGAVAVLYHLYRPEHRLKPDAPLLLLLGIGTIAFLVAGSVGLLLEGAFLDYPAGAAYVMILLVEIAVAASVAVTLGLLFVAADAGEDARGGNG